MAQLRELLIEQLQRLLDAENRLVAALAEMSRAANNAKLREGIQKHLSQTEKHVDRLEQAFNLLGAKRRPDTVKSNCRADPRRKRGYRNGPTENPLAADLGLIAAAQAVEHYEISAYGTARSLARLLGETKVASLLSLTLGEEESADHLLTEIAKPLAQEATAAELAVAGR